MLVGKSAVLVHRNTTSGQVITHDFIENREKELMHRDTTSYKWKKITEITETNEARINLSCRLNTSVHFFYSLSKEKSVLMLKSDD